MAHYAENLGIYVEMLKVEVVDTVLLVKMNFTQGSCEAAQVAKGIRFKSCTAKRILPFVS